MKNQFDTNENTFHNVEFFNEKYFPKVETMNDNNHQLAKILQNFKTKTKFNQPLKFDQDGYVNISNILECKFFENLVLDDIIHIHNNDK